jgi:hypothetical protein
MIIELILSFIRFLSRAEFSIFPSLIECHCELPFLRKLRTSLRQQLALSPVPRYEGATKGRIRVRMIAAFAVHSKWGE